MIINYKEIEIKNKGFLKFDLIYIKNTDCFDAQSVFLKTKGDSSKKIYYLTKKHNKK